MAEKEYIEREAVLKMLNRYFQNLKGCEAQILVSDIKHGTLELPTADVVEVVHGEWIDKPTGRYCHIGSYCSVCGKKSGICGIGSNRHKPYCPNCGAKMDGKEPLVKKNASPTDMSRCRKCVYEMTCFRGRDFEGTCPDYKRDAPDGG